MPGARTAATSQGGCRGPCSMVLCPGGGRERLLSQIVARAAHGYTADYQPPSRFGPAQCSLASDIGRDEIVQAVLADLPSRATIHAVSIPARACSRATIHATSAATAVGLGEIAAADDARSEPQSQLSLYRGPGKLNDSRHLPFRTEESPSQLPGKPYAVGRGHLPETCRPEHLPAQEYSFRP